MSESLERLSQVPASCSFYITTKRSDTEPEIILIESFGRIAERNIFLFSKRGCRINHLVITLCMCKYQHVYLSLIYPVDRKLSDIFCELPHSTQTFVPFVVR